MPINNLKNLFKINDTYYINYTINGKRIKKTLNTKSYKEARSKADNILKPIKGIKTYKDVVNATAKAKDIYATKEIFVSDAWSPFKLSLQRENTSRDTRRTYSNRWHNFTSWMMNHHSNIKTLSEITTDITILYADHLNTCNISVKVYNESLNNLKRLYQYFLKDLNVSVNPFSSNVIKRKNKKASTIPHMELSIDEANNILNSFSKIKLKDINELEVLFFIGIYTGMRLKDCCFLEWKNVKLNTHFIYITPQKTKAYGTKSRITIINALSDKLKDARKWKLADSDYVLPHVAKRYQKCREAISKAVMKIFKYNGFINTKEKASTRKASTKYGFHSLRYTFVAVCAQNNIPLALVQDIVGHTSLAMTKYYTRFTPEYQQEQMRKFTLTTHSKIRTIDEAIEIKKEIREDLEYQYFQAFIPTLSDSQLIELLHAFNQIAPGTIRISEENILIDKLHETDLSLQRLIGEGVTILNIQKGMGWEAQTFTEDELKKHKIKELQERIKLLQEELEKTQIS